MLHGSGFPPAFPARPAPSVIGTGLEASWQRCRHDYALDPSTPVLPDVLSGTELRHACQHAGRMLYFAGPEMVRLHHALEPVGYTALLADTAGVVLAHNVAGALQRGCRRWNLWPGAVWHERHAGTNGIGTCLAEQRSISVHRNEHWRSFLHGLTGIATPVYDAMGRMAGALNASSYRPSPDGSLGALIASSLLQAARQIEQAFFMDLYRGHTIMLLGPPQGASASVPMMALNRERHVVGATHAARVQMGLPPAGDVNLCLMEETVQRSPLREAQAMAIRTALASAGGKVAVAARMLGISRSTLHRKLRALDGTRAAMRP
ncbi:sigma-54-dependent Fis family transcriptional regulator [Komagataeibacter sp. AV436]|uniref:Sigma-54-dependent Fis family transcriptional regulator n=1 Tax=Komagataeibacter melomenusus TaxID=2766578 RepID=A0ABX2AD82_9PROT|nr:helix-turn-helix domain-containing protein [Komagataeibacter melomenusus]MBV1830399.1 sigma-54-dependent Fis family transcriptional regulator [Komagataeibacter melomenusus]NPC66091.1 sigma-54-dependent Fis family transcriptional regulator [Komagataeibacter melomenusus]